jgi:hypothetical protein
MMQTHPVGVELIQTARMERHAKMLIATYKNVPYGKTVKHRTKLQSKLHNT